MFQYFKLTFLAPLHWHTYIYWHKALVLWTFVPYSTQEGFGIGCDFVQFGIPDLRIRRLREEVHLTDLHIMPHVDPSPPGWLGSEPNSSGLAPPSLQQSQHFRRSEADEVISGSRQLNWRVNFLVTCFRAHVQNPDIVIIVVELLGHTSQFLRRQNQPKISWHESSHLFFGSARSLDALGIEIPSKASKCLHFWPFIFHLTFAIFCQV